MVCSKDALKAQHAAALNPPRKLNKAARDERAAAILAHMGLCAANLQVEQVLTAMCISHHPSCVPVLCDQVFPLLLLDYGKCCRR